MYVEPLVYNKSDSPPSDQGLPVVICNLSSTEQLYLGKDQVVAFAEPNEAVHYVEIQEAMDSTPRHWIPK